MKWLAGGVPWGVARPSRRDYLLAGIAAVGAGLVAFAYGLAVVDANVKSSMPYRASVLAMIWLFLITLAWRVQRRLEAANEWTPRTAAWMYGLCSGAILIAGLLLFPMSLLAGNSAITPIGYMLVMFPMMTWLNARRVTGRRLCAKCGYLYSDDARMPVCSECGADWKSAFGLKSELGPIRWKPIAAVLGVTYLVIFAPLLLRMPAVVGVLPDFMLRSQARGDDWQAGPAWKELISRGMTATERPELVTRLLDQRKGTSPSLSNDALKWLEAEVLAGRVGGAERERYFLEMYEPELKGTVMPRVGTRIGAYVSFVCRAAVGQGALPYARVVSMEISPAVESTPTKMMGRVTSVFEAWERYRFQAEPTQPINVATMNNGLPGRSFDAAAEVYHVKAVVYVWCESNGPGVLKATSAFDGEDVLVPSATTVWWKRVELESDIKCEP